jgi:hypothetical protein
MTELRQQMEKDMVLRGMADATREAYLAAVTGLARFYRRAPDQIADTEVQAYLLHLLQERCRRICCICSRSGSGPGARSISPSTACASSIT